MLSKIIACMASVAILAVAGCGGKRELAALRTQAEQGKAEAQCRLGLYYFSGKRVVHDESEAAKWFRKAAEQGNSKAQYKLGVCFDVGAGVIEDKIEAVQWYRKAAEQGNREAQFVLGLCYYGGEGVAGDVSEAYKWFLLASISGDKQARTECTAIAVKMTAAQIAEAEARADKWQQEKEQSRPTKE